MNMSYIHYSRHKLGTINPNGTASRLKEKSILDVDPKTLCFLTFHSRDKGRRRIQNAYSLSAIINMLENELSSPSDPTIRTRYKGRRKRLSCAKKPHLTDFQV